MIDFRQLQWLFALRTDGTCSWPRDGEPSREGSGAEDWTKSSPQGDMAAGSSRSQNRLIKVTAKGTETVNTYDALSRRVRRTVTSGSTVTSDTGYVYDGWNVIAEYNLANGTPTLAAVNTWGPDLSNSTQSRRGRRTPDADEWRNNAFLHLRRQRERERVAREHRNPRRAL